MITGKFVVIEGVEGTGKTSVVAKVVEHYANQYVDVVKTRSPGGSGFTTDLRALLFDLQPTNNVDAMLLAILLDRVMLNQLVIDPAVRKGSLVVCDRYRESTMAYQSATANKSCVETYLKLEAELDVRIPDLTILLDMTDNPDARLQRLANRNSNNAINSKGLAFQNHVETVFNTRFKHNTGDTLLYNKHDLAHNHARKVVVNADQPLDAVVKAVITKVDEVLLGIHGDGVS